MFIKYEALDIQPNPRQRNIIKLNVTQSKGLQINLDSWVKLVQSESSWTELNDFIAS